MRISILVFAMLAGLLAACSSPGPSTTTLHLVERATTDAVGDVAPEGDSVGDVLGFANEVFDETNTTKMGTDNGMCLRTAAGSAWECVWTVTLNDGQITVEGPFYDAGDSVLAITGGTGAYAEARGEMQLHARNAAGSEYDFTYRILR
jgi:hypothetical protein